MKTFADRKAALERLGWQITVRDEYRGEAGKDRVSHNLELFSSVRLPLTPRDWCRLCMREGEDYLSIPTSEGPRHEDSEYIGGCCGTMSAIQDTLNGWFRDGGWVNVDEFVQMGDAMRDHGDWEFFEELSLETLAERVDACVELQKNPPTAVYTTAWGKLGLLYQLVKNHHVPEIPKAPGNQADELQSAFRLVSRMSWAYGIGDLFTNSQTTKTTKNAGELVGFHRFVPALKLVAERAHEIIPEPIEGWALVDLQVGEGEVAENRMGMCVYATKPEAQNILDLFTKARDQYEEPNRVLENAQFKLRAVRISWEKGLEFLDEGAEPKTKIPWKRKPGWLEEPVEDVGMLFKQYAKTRRRLTDAADEYDGVYDEASNAWEEAARFFSQQG